MNTQKLIRSCHAGPLLIRATTDPGDLIPVGDLDLFSNAIARDGHAWLDTVWRRQEIRDAVQLASPALARQTEKVLTDRPGDRDVRRTVISLASYLLRWQGRATPFGLFSGVAAADVRQVPSARWEERHRVVVRPGAAWLGALVGRLEQSPELLDRLAVVANNSAFARGDRLVIPGQPSDDNPGQVAPLEVSIRHSRPVRIALEAARQPCRFGGLVQLLSASYPAAAPDRLRAMLTELVTQRALVTALRAPMTEPDPLSHLIEQLAVVGLDHVSGVSDLRVRLLEIRHDLSHPDIAAPRAIAGGESRLATAARRMRRVCDAAEQPLLADVGLSCDVAVPEPVIREAESAACVLLRLTPHPFGYPHWKDYHARFRDRYGTGALVPVCELVQADTGLGAPAGFLGSPIALARPALTARDERLLAIVQLAVMEGHDEIVLDDRLIESLTVGELTERLLPPRIEIGFHVVAASGAAVASGDFRLLVSSTPRPGSSMAGRFAQLLTNTDRARLADSYELADNDTGTVAAQLSFAGRRRHGDNVTRVPQLLPAVISLAEHRAEQHGVISLADLAVTADVRQMYLVQVSTGRRVEPRVLHALEAGAVTPPLARFLAEVTNARCAVYAGFDWGAASRLPYLPRLRFGRAVLSPARWLLTTADLTVPDPTTSGWERALDAWRHRMRVPAHLVLCEGELRLPLQLESQLHRAVLRARLRRACQVELREDIGHGRSGWPGRPHEFLLPIRLPPKAASPPAQPPSPGQLVSRRAGHLPGVGAVLYAQIRGHPDRQDEILTTYVARLLDWWEVPPLWWYSRYRDMTRPDSDQHLDIYLRLPAPDDCAAACAHLGRWADHLRDCGLSADLALATYHPDTGRFGHGAAMAAAEETFAADSAAALAQIAASGRAGIPGQSLTVAGMVDLASSLACDVTEGMRWLIDLLPKEQGTQERSLRDTALKLADPAEDLAMIRALPGGEEVADAWWRRRRVLAEYRAKLAEQRDPRSVLRSFLHLHHVRCLPTDPERERISNRLARAVALQYVVRNPG